MILNSENSSNFFEAKNIYVLWSWPFISDFGSADKVMKEETGMGDKSVQTTAE